MKILVLSSNHLLYSTKRLVEEISLAGHSVDVIDPCLCYMSVASGNPMVFFDSRALKDYDAIIPRVGAGASTFGMSVVRQFEMMGIYCLNSANSIGRSRDKLRSLQILSQKNIPLPKTGFASNTESTNGLMEVIDSAPAVVKLLEGSQGRGVVLAETKKSLESLIDAFRELNANFLVQDFIADANGSDIRCFVVGDKVVASMMRTARDGEFRSNIHRGGEGKVVEITALEQKIAISTAKAMKLNMAGVDIIRSKEGPRVLEVNSSPGLEGIEKCTKINIAKEIISYIEVSYKKIKKDT